MVVVDRIARPGLCQPHEAEALARSGRDILATAAAGAPEPLPNGQIPAVMMVQRPDRLRRVAPNRRPECPISPTRSSSSLTSNTASTWIQHSRDRTASRQFSSPGKSLAAPDAQIPYFNRLPRRRLTFAEGRHVARGVAADIGANGGEHLRRVNGAHHLPATGGNASTQQQTIEVHPLVA